MLFKKKHNKKTINDDKTIIKPIVKNLRILFSLNEILSLYFKIKNKPTNDRNITAALNKNIKIIEEEFLWFNGSNKAKIKTAINIIRK